MARIEHAAALARNPFEITKASYFTDQQINDYWVDLPHGRGFSDLMYPTSLMPKFILGGKGSGKTHLMRHFSYELQKYRHDSDLLNGIKKDEYIGIYHVFGGLNSGRFSGKNRTDEQWSNVYSYYTDTSLAIQLLGIIKDLLVHAGEKIQDEPGLCKSLLSLFALKHSEDCKTLESLIIFLNCKKTAIDFAVNNLALTGKLDVVIETTRGSLIFDIPSILQEFIPSLEGVTFLYLLDELENLNVFQQRYINTLMRDAKAPCSFRVGARLYGVKTYETFSDGEINKKDAEYETVELDQFLRDSKDNYKDFATTLITRRIIEAGFFSKSEMPAVKAGLFEFFDTPQKTKFFEDETSFIPQKYKDKIRPYLNIQKKLMGDKSLRLTEKQAEEIVSFISFPEIPIIEKVNLLLLYKVWASGKGNLLKEAERIGADARCFAEGDKNVKHSRILEHFGSDLLAQACRSCDRPTNYLGLQTFIDMSCGTPRNLLIILKNIYKWSINNGEQPFSSKPISTSSQIKGVKEASQWFYKTARLIGENEMPVLNSISRLAELFKELRFADRLVDPSLVTFSYPERKISQRANEIISLAEKWSLLISIDHGSKDKNSKSVDPKYQLNQMLAPYWDLPLYRRGSIPLTPEFIEVIFSSKDDLEFKHLKNKRIGSHMAPFSIKDNSDELTQGYLL